MFAFALTALTLLALPLAAAEPGFTPLFDGKSLDGWQLVRGRGTGYVVENGSLVCPADGGGNLFTKKQYSNFILRFDFKLSEGGNNGIGIRAPLEGDAAYVGMEIQVLDDSAPTYAGKLQPWQYHGSVYGVVAAKQGFRKPAGEWNSQEIRAEGSKITVTLNGHVIVDANLADVKDAEIIRKHPGILRTGGHIGLLGHGTKVEFRNLRIKELN